MSEQKASLLEQQVAETIAAIREKTDAHPKIAIILGTGLGRLADAMTEIVVIPYGELPHWKVPTTADHAGNLLFGKLAGKEVMCMQGRLHYYEGYSMQEITYPIRVMAKLGITTLLLTNNSGGISQALQPGDLMMITDHINMTGTNPLIGPNEDGFGPRYPDMTYAYAPALQQIARECAAEQGISLREGVYIGLAGPCFETPAEIRMYRTWGADAVGQSTVPEVIVANHCGIRVLAVSCVCNKAAGMTEERLSEEEIIAAGQLMAGKLSTLMEAVIRRL